MLGAISFGGLILIIISIMFVGMAKAGIAGAGTLTIPIVAAVLGGKASVGFLLPILLLSDIVAVVYYRKTVKWDVLISILPWGFVGIGIGTVVGKLLNDVQFNVALATVILIGAGIMVWRDYISKSSQVPTSKLFAVFMGLFAGFTSMLGNASGPVIAIFLLSLHIPKQEFAGTRAWYFFIMNAVKFPLYMFVWKTISLTTLRDGALLIPALIVGMLIGFKLVKIIPEKLFRIIILVLIVVSAMGLLFK